MLILKIQYSFFWYICTYKTKDSKLSEDAQYQKGQQALGTVFMNCFCTKQISNGIILQPEMQAPLENEDYEGTTWGTSNGRQMTLNLSIKEDSCKVIVFLVLTTVKLQITEKLN